MPLHDVKSSTSDELISGSDLALRDESPKTSLEHTEDGEYSAPPLIYTIGDPECVVDHTIHTSHGESHPIGSKDDPADTPCTAKGGTEESLDDSKNKVVGTCIPFMGPEVSTKIEDTSGPFNSIADFVITDETAAPISKKGDDHEQHPETYKTRHRTGKITPQDDPSHFVFVDRARCN